jgi:hypothetical protein
MNKPSFVYGYWRPWNENSNLIESYLDYNRDMSLQNYNADIIGNYIQNASKEHLKIISEVGYNIGSKLDKITNEINLTNKFLENINQEIYFVNRSLDRLVNQQIITNLLLEDIKNLLKVSDSEKIRINSIELGLKFFEMAKKNTELYDDALEEFLKAESIKKQDFSVLFQIGIIYLYSTKHINILLAKDYFSKAIKYASLELEGEFNATSNEFIDRNRALRFTHEKSDYGISFLISESFQNIAFCDYILANFISAVEFQKKAILYNETSENYFLLSKYQIRANYTSDAIESISKSIDLNPNIINAVFKEIDLLNSVEILKHLDSKNDTVNNLIEDLINDWRNINSFQSEKNIVELEELKSKDFKTKVIDFETMLNKKNLTEVLINKATEEANLLIEKINNDIVLLDKSTVSDITKELLSVKDSIFEQGKEILKKNKKIYDENKLQIGSFYQGGIVIELDDSGKHGKVCTDKSIGKYVWSESIISIFGNEGKIPEYKFKGMKGVEITKKIVEVASTKSRVFGMLTEPVPTAARICYELIYNGYKNWYLPSPLDLMKIFEIKDKLNLNINSDFLSEELFWSHWEDRYKSAYAYPLKRGGIHNLAIYCRRKDEKLNVIAVKDF